jgi:hypothetical protein
MRLRLLLGLCTVVAVLALPAVAGADPFTGPPICATAGTAVSGTYHHLAISGDAYVPAGETLTVRDNLKIRRDGCLDAFTLGTVTVGRNILVNKGAVLALGCTPESIGPGAPCNGQTTNDTVGRNIIGHHPLTMYLDGNTIGGSVISIGGGPGLGEYAPFLNFPIKDNTIGKNLIVKFWKGGWSGAIRNDVGGNLIWSHNKSVLDPDSNEVQTNTVGRNLSCWGNSPKAQINAADGGMPNIVGGHKLGQCAGL